MKRRQIYRLYVLLFFSLFVSAPRGVSLSVLAIGRSAVAQTQETKPSEKPVLLLSMPLGVPEQEPARMILRGLRLDGATGVRCSLGASAVKLIGSAKAVPPANVSAQKVGDTQVEVEFDKVDRNAEELECIVTTPAGDSETYRIPILKKSERITSDTNATSLASRVIVETEPNPGYRQNQALQSSQVVLGAIQSALDVDVYSITLTVPSRIEVSVVAEKLGSACDPLLTFKSESGVTLASSDDVGESRDSRIEASDLPAGKYFVVVQDANDQGGPLHLYRLVVRSAAVGEPFP